ncbi:MAG: DUF3277 family protein [Gammaproteobacteria bacterium]|nr:DUF3277 family protein [Gammaproteobacteria bacterium]
MASLPVYSSRDVQLFWSGVHLEGLAPDPFLVSMRNEDLTDEEVGAGGDLSVSKLANRTGLLTITFQQQAVTNKILAKLVLDQEQGSNLFVGDLTIKDLSGGIISEHRDCHLKGTPEQSLGSTATGSSRAWVFFVGRFDFSGLTDSDKANPLVAAKEGLIDSAVESIKGSAKDYLSGKLGDLF